MGFIITGGESADCNQALPLLKGISEYYVSCDKGYEVDYIVDKVIEIGADPVIPPRKHRINPRDYDAELYKERNVIEILFNKIKRFRHFSTRYDKLVRNYLSFVHFIAALLLLK